MRWDCWMTRANIFCPLYLISLVIEQAHFSLALQITRIKNAKWHFAVPYAIMGLTHYSRNSTETSLTRLDAGCQGENLLVTVLKLCKHHLQWKEIADWCQNDRARGYIACNTLGLQYQKVESNFICYLETAHIQTGLCQLQWYYGVATLQLKVDCERVFKAKRWPLWRHNCLISKRNCQFFTMRSEFDMANTQLQRSAISQSLTGK